MYGPLFELRLLICSVPRVGRVTLEVLLGYLTRPVYDGKGHMSVPVSKSFRIGEGFVVYNRRVVGMGQPD